MGFIATLFQLLNLCLHIHFPELNIQTQVDNPELFKQDDNKQEKSA